MANHPNLQDTNDDDDIKSGALEGGRGGGGVLGWCRGGPGEVLLGQGRLGVGRGRGNVGGASGEGGEEGVQ